MDDQVGRTAASEGHLKLYSSAGMTNGSVNVVIEMRGFSSGCPYVTMASVRRSLNPGANSGQNAAPSDGLFMNTSLFWESTFSEVVVATQTESDS
jgi:hypothetical protein